MHCFLLARSFSEEFPFILSEYSNVELSAEDDGSDLTVDSDSAADMAASDDTVASEDTNLSIDATDSDVSTDEEGSSIAAVNSDKENESDDFSSDDSQEVFSDGTATDIDSELDYVLGRPMTDEEREAQLAMIPELTDMPVTDEVTSDLDIVPYALYPEEYNSAKEGLVTPVKIRVRPASAGISVLPQILRPLFFQEDSDIMISQKSILLISGPIA